MPKKKKAKLTPEQIAAANQQLAELEAQLAGEMTILGPSELEVGRILYVIKRCLIQWGWNKGKNGRWAPLVSKHGMDRKTAENRIRKYQTYASIPPRECVIQPASPKQPRVQETQQYRENNPVRLTGLHQPGIKPADDEDCDRSPEQRIGVECVFVLTMKEKREFMKAVQALGPLLATQVIYKAVLGAAPKAEGATS